jgi:antitoxin component HigA of HigAB toxin-antitoxin module
MLSKLMKIKSNSQYKNALVKIEKLIKKGFGNLSKKETERLKQTSIAIQGYEKVKYKPILYFIFLIQLTLLAYYNPTSKPSKGDPVIAIKIILKGI